MVITLCTNLRHFMGDVAKDLRKQKIMQNQNILIVHALVTSSCLADCMPVAVSHAALLNICNYLVFKNCLSAANLSNDVTLQ